MKIKVWASTSRVGSKQSQTVEIDNEEWAEMSDKEKEDYMHDCMHDLVDWGYEELP